MRVLLVENDPAAAIIATTKLGANGIHCDTAKTMSEAFSLLNLRAYCSAILDRLIEGESTESLAWHLRLRHPATRIILMTGPSVQTNGFGLDRLCADFLVRKPLPFPDLIEIMKYLKVTSEWFDHPEAGLQYAIPTRTSGRRFSRC